MTFDPNRCIHYAACIRALPAVFDAKARPWIRPEAATPDAVAAAVLRCPSGALHERRVDGGPAESPDEPATVTAKRDGPLFVRGDVRLALDDGGRVVLHDARVALCRCGHSANQPYCDGTHRAIGWRDGAEAHRPAAPAAAMPDGVPVVDGPREGPGGGGEGAAPETVA